MFHVLYFAVVSHVIQPFPILASAAGQSKILLAILCLAWLDIELVS